MNKEKLKGFAECVGEYFKLISEIKEDDVLRLNIGSAKDLWDVYEAIGSATWSLFKYAKNVEYVFGKKTELKNNEFIKEALIAEYMDTFL